MIFVVLELLLIAGIFTLATVVDRRYPDRLSRRGRFLAGLPLDEARPRRPSNAARYDAN